MYGTGKMLPENSSMTRDRGAMERLRRRQMKSLYAELASLLPPEGPESTKEKLPLPALLEKAFTYVKDLKEKIDKLKEEKERLKGLVVPEVAVNEMGSLLEVNLLTGLNKSFMLHEVLRILQEEGAVILNLHYTTSSDRTFYTVRSQAFSSRIGIETSRVQERLKALCQDPDLHYPSNYHLKTTRSLRGNEKII